jgi:hypothetical protein
LGFSAILLLARLLSVPALSNPVSGHLPAGLRLTVPTTYLVLAPLFSLWDGVSMLSLSRLRGFMLGLVLLYLLWRIVHYRTRPRQISWWSELAALALSILLLSVFLVAGAVWHRPMLRLEGAAADETVVDFHSHTNVSHDVRDTWMRGFDAEASRRWHARAGFDAFFITDHNSVAALSPRHQAGHPVICPGTEVSAWHSHIVLLGDSIPVDRRRYDGSLDELLGLLRVSHAEYGALSVASLPEYRRNLWQRLDTLMSAGLDGFEIVNAAPKANELIRSERDYVVQQARAHNRFVVGVSDSHGWGATSMVWNLMAVPPGVGDLCSSLLRKLGQGFGSVTIVERHRLRPDDWWPGWLTPLGVIWETWRSLGSALTWSWLGWIWGSAAAYAGWTIALEKRRRARLAGASLGDQDRP